MLEVERIITENPQCMHQYMTSEMEEWELQWECQHWYQMKAVTPLYIAAAYAQAEAVRWLLDRGADTTTKNYHGQSALDVVGEFAPPTRHDDTLRCKELLKGPKRVPIPPNDPACEAKVSALREVLVEVGEDSEEGELAVVSQSATATVRKKVVRRLDARCEITASWYTAWLPGGTRYELRYKPLGPALLAAAAAVAAGGGGSGGGGGGKKAGKKNKVGWTSEVTRGTRFTLRELSTSTRYAFQVRACNDVGWGPYSEEVTTETPPHPSPERAVEGQG